MNAVPTRKSGRRSTIVLSVIAVMFFVGSGIVFHAIKVFNGGPFILAVAGIVCVISIVFKTDDKRYEQPRQPLLTKKMDDNAKSYILRWADKR